MQEVEHGVFTPLVLATTGGLAKECDVFYKRFASLVAEKHHQPHSLVMGWLRCILSFALLRSAILCIHGTRSFQHHPWIDSSENMGSIDLVTSEAMVGEENINY